MVADQEAAPAAVPESPVPVDHLTDATPVSSDAVPATVMDAAEVERMVEPGVTMRMEGAVVSLGGAAGGSGGGRRGR